MKRWRPRRPSWLPGGAKEDQATGDQAAQGVAEGHGDTNSSEVSDQPSPPARRSRNSMARRRSGKRQTHPAFSHGAMHRAWRSVRSNGGGPGVDGQDIRAFESNLRHELGRLRSELVAGTYRPRGVRRVFVPKPREGLRPLAIWTLRDRVAQRAVHDFLEPHFEERFLDCSHGFRPGRSVATAVRDVATARDEGLRWVLDTDIEDCFGRIDPERLQRMLRRQVKDRHVLQLVQRWLEAEILDIRGQRMPAGAAQGGPLAPLLSNVYLHAFDVALTKRGLHLVRYADDFVCLCRSRREAESARSLAANELGKLGLSLHPRKTRIVSFDEGFPFLGVFFLRDEHFDLS